MKKLSKIIMLAFSSAILFGCTAPSLGQVNTNESCEQKIVRAMTSPNKPVAGAYVCIDNTDQSFIAQLAQAGISDDKTLAQFAGQAPVYTSAQLCPKQTAANFRIYQLSHGVDHQVMGLHIADNGKVDVIRFAGMQSTCADVGAA